MPIRTTHKGAILGLAAGVLAVCLTGPAVMVQSRGAGRALPAPPPPTVELKKEPEVILIPQSRVYYVPDLKYDLFRYGRYWYINNEGNWYRARSYRGPFKNVGFSRVPRSIAQVPARYHKHPLTRPAADPGITRSAGDAVQRTIGTRKPPASGLGNRKSAITRPTGKLPVPTRRTWNRTAQPPSKDPAVKSGKSPAVGKQPAGRKQAKVRKTPPSSTVKKRATTGKRKVPQSVKKPARGSGTKKVQQAKTKSKASKSAKSKPKKKPAPKKSKKTKKTKK